MRHAPAAALLVALALLLPGAMGGTTEELPEGTGTLVTLGAEGATFNVTVKLVIPEEVDSTAPLGIVVWPDLNTTGTTPSPYTVRLTFGDDLASDTVDLAQADGEAVLRFDEDFVDRAVANLEVTVELAAGDLSDSASSTTDVLRPGSESEGLRELYIAYILMWALLIAFLEYVHVRQRALRRELWRLEGAREGKDGEGGR